MECKRNEIFSIIENELYNEYPEIKKQECYFLYNGSKINSKLTLKEIDIKNGDTIIISFEECSFYIIGSKN